MRRTLRRFLTDDGASAATEYGMLAAAITLLAVIVLTHVGINFRSAFELLGIISRNMQC